LAHGEGEESSSDREALASGDAHGWAMQRTVDGKCAKQGGSPRAGIFWQVREAGRESACRYIRQASHGRARPSADCRMQRRREGEVAALEDAHE
jgi:hypothetical protein